MDEGHEPAGLRRSQLRAYGLAIVRTSVGLLFIGWLYSLTPEDVRPSMLLPASLLVIGAIVYLLVLRWQVSRILRSQFPGILAGEALILSAAIFLTIFGVVYMVINSGNPQSFTEPLTHFTALYLSVTILSTVGFGDVTAVTDAARTVVMIQMILTLGFLAVTFRVFARAASRAQQSRSQDGESPKEDQ